MFDVAETADIAFGRFLIDHRRRLLMADGKPVPLQQRSFDLLAYLVAHRDRVVPRDEILAQVFGGQIRASSNVPVQIHNLRRGLIQAGADAGLIQTVGQAYRFIGEAALALPAPMPESIAEVPPPPPPPAGQARRWLALLAVCLGCLAIAGGAVWQLWPHPKWTVESSQKVLPSLQGQTSPRVSPNGSMLAYVVNAASGHGRIYVGNLQGGAPQPVSAPDENADAPAWASDGVHLAYVVIDPRGAPCRIMVTRFPGGTPHIAGRCRYAAMSDLAWRPGTPYVLLCDSHDTKKESSVLGALFQMDVDTGMAQQLSSPHLNEEDCRPRTSPDGKWLAYIRGNGFLGGEIRLRRFATGQERVLQSDPAVTSLDWTPDSRSLIASVSGQMSDYIMAYPIDGAPGYRIYASSARIDTLATGPGGTLAVVVFDGRYNLARATTTPRISADIIDPAPGNTDFPTFAPDGTLAFVSDRSGENALWTRKPGSQPVEIVSGAKDIERPVWSPDGSRIAFFEVWKGAITVHVVTAQGESVVSFDVPSIGYGYPTWTQDGEHLLVFDKRILRSVRVDLHHPDHREPIEDKLWLGLTYRNGAVYATHGLDAGFWQLNGGPRLISPDYPAVRGTAFAFIGDDVLVPDFSDAANPRILAQPLKGGQSRVAFYAPAAEAYSPLAVDPSTGDVVYVSEVVANSHIDELALKQQ